MSEIRFARRFSRQQDGGEFMQSMIINRRVKRTMVLSQSRLFFLPEYSSVVCIEQTKKIGKYDNGDYYFEGSVRYMYNYNHCNDFFDKINLKKATKTRLLKKIGRQNAVVRTDHIQEDIIGTLRPVNTFTCTYFMSTKTTRTPKLIKV